MNMIKNNGGFTLVELIVVIAILGILTTVAAPVYSGYIEKANDAAILSELTAIQTAAQSACALEGTSVKTITITSTGEISFEAEDDNVQEKANDNFKDFYTDSNNIAELIAKHSVAKDSGATWNGEWNILSSDSSSDNA